MRLRAGDLAGAEADARACLELAAEPGRGIPHPLAASALASVLIERGDLREARDALGQLDVGVYDPEVTPIQAIREIRAKLSLAEGKPDAALEELLACSRWEADWQASAGVVPVAWRSLGALARSAQGATAEARDLAAREVELARRFGSPLALGVALRHVAPSRTTRTESNHSKWPSWCSPAAAHGSSTHALWSRWEHCFDARGSVPAALERLLEGMDLAQRCGATALVTYARDELRLAGARPRRMAPPDSTRSPRPSAVWPSSRRTDCTTKRSRKRSS